MIVIKPTAKPCFLCGKAAHTVEAKFKDGTFTGVLCKDHLFERMEAMYLDATDDKKPVLKSA